MGRMTAEGMAAAVADGSLNLHSALLYHLRNNHYPPLPASLVGVCERAIELAQQGRLHWQLVHVATAAEVIEKLHLEPFVSPFAGEPEDA